MYACRVVHNIQFMETIEMFFLLRVIGYGLFIFPYQDGASNSFFIISRRYTRYWYFHTGYSPKLDMCLCYILTNFITNICYIFCWYLDCNAIHYYMILSFHSLHFLLNWFFVVKNYNVRLTWKLHASF